MRQRRLDFGKLIKVLGALAIIFIVAFVVIFAVAQNFNLLFTIADIAYILLGVNFILYFLYKILIDGTRWIRVMVFGLSSLLFIILSLSFASGNISAYISNSTTAPPIVGTNIFLSFIGLAVGGILYYMTFNSHPLYWIEDLKEKVEDQEHKNKWLAKIVRKLKRV